MTKLEIGYLLPTRDQAVRGEHEPGRLVAQATERVTLGAAVLLPALRHPILLAHQLATHDHDAGLEEFADQVPQGHR